VTRIKFLTTTHAICLLAIAGSSLAEGIYGGELIAVPVQTIAALAAAAVVVWRRRPTFGVIVAGWLALGPIVMPFASDNLRSGDPGLVASTVAYLAAIATALASGALALAESRRGGRTQTLTERAANAERRVDVTRPRPAGEDSPGRRRSARGRRQPRGCR
jgi:hypothetical protein